MSLLPPLSSQDPVTRRSSLPLLFWGGILLVAAVAFRLLVPAVFPLLPDDWSVSRAEARARALELLRELGSWPADSLIVVRMEDDFAIERRLLETYGAEAPARAPRGLKQRIRYWEVSVYPPKANAGEWSHRAAIALDGTILALRRSFDPNEGSGTLSSEEALQRAQAFLAETGVPLEGYEAPEIRRTELANRGDVEFRFGSKESAVPAQNSFGIVVRFAGQELAGIESWIEDPEMKAAEAELRPFVVLGNLQFFSNFFWIFLLTILFFRRYHAGEVGVRRSLHLFLVLLAGSLIVLLFTSVGSTEALRLGTLSREQTTWVWAGQILLLYYLPLALVAFLAWAVGESICRERWGTKLAAFDALLQGRVQNRTVALSSLRGVAAGWALAAALLALLRILRGAEVWSTQSFLAGPFWHQGPASGVMGSIFLMSYSLVATLAGRLFLVSWLTRKLGPWAGVSIASLVTSFLAFAPISAVPASASILLWIVVALVSSLLFLRYDFLTSWLALAVVYCALSSPLFLFSQIPATQLQGWILVLAPALPLFLSLRHLGSEQTFDYRWDDVPEHVRRIAERERQRLELETARSIQAAILPPVPASLHGCELAVHYEPATEVGGDFYAASPLPDRRIALCLGDVAGHGVSSGLIMAMVRAALEVQVENDPSVRTVFRRLNRLVHSSAQRRHLVTLCYGILDPRRRNFEFGCAGQIFPYRIRRNGTVQPLESISYPLGVRAELELEAKTVALEPGDRLLLASDGAVELRHPKSDELYGFERFEEAIRSAPPGSVSQLVEFLRKDLERFRGERPREDDLTLLAVSIP